MTIHKPSLDLWSKTTRQVAEELDAKFPRSEWTSTYRGHGENGAGWSIDLMCNKADGDRIAAYAWKHRQRLGIWYIIWNRRIISQTRPSAGWLPYWDGWNSNPSKAHTNHVHISRYPGRSYTAPAGGAPSVDVPPKKEKPKGKDTGKKVVRYTRIWGAKGWDAKKIGVVKHVRPRGFRVKGTIVERTDGQYVRTAWNTDYPMDELSSKRQNIPAKRKGVSLAAVRAAAKRDPKKPNGFHTAATADDVRMVEAALQAEGLLEGKWAKDGSFGSVTVDAYSAWQKKLGYRGRDANGIPGLTSLRKLGKRYGFKVHKHD